MTNKPEDPKDTFEKLRRRVLRGSGISLDTLSDQELVAANRLVLYGDAEIISSACRPYLARKLDRIVISH